MSDVRRRPSHAAAIGKANASFAEIAAVLREQQRFVVVSHVGPTATRSAARIALGLSLRAMGKDVTLWNEDGMLDKLRLPARLGTRLAARRRSRRISTCSWRWTPRPTRVWVRR